MGEIADDLIDKMMDDGYFPSRAFMPHSCNRGTKKNGKPVPKGAFDEETRAAEFPSKKTPLHLLRDYPEKTFNMDFFPTAKREVVVEDPWKTDSEDAPF